MWLTSGAFHDQHTIKLSNFQSVFWLRPASKYLLQRLPLKLCVESSDPVTLFWAPAGLKLNGQMWTSSLTRSNRNPASGMCAVELVCFQLIFSPPLKHLGTLWPTCGEFICRRLNLREALTTGWTASSESRQLFKEKLQKKNHSRISWLQSHYTLKIN